MLFGVRSIFMTLRESILKTMAYFDVFHYPLTLKDICHFLDVTAEEEAIGLETEALVEEGRLYRIGAFYSLHDNPALAMRRLRGEAHADELLVIANRGARLLYQFPYVRGVCISGSLSKRCADDKADIDYFIITKANRLWIARTLMHLFKKLTYLRGHQHRYCMNYYVDEDALEIMEKNVFTAVELFTLMPVCGNGGLTRFFRANEWAGRFFPRYGKEKREVGDHRPGLLKRVIERIFDHPLGDRLENYLRSLTDRRWKQKTERGDVNMKGDTMTLQCGAHYSRPDPGIFQQRILNRYQSRIREVMDHPVFRKEMM
jgi:hypothetical protein